MISYIKKLQDNYLLPLVSRLVLMFLAIVMIPQYIKYWGASTYKEYVFIFSLVAYTNIVINPMNIFLLKIKSRINKIKFIEIVSFGFFFTFILSFFVLLICLFIMENKLYIYVFGLLMIFFTFFSGIMRNIFIAIEKINTFSKIEIFFMILKFPVVFFISIYFFEYKFISFFVLFLVIFFIENLSYFLFLSQNKLIDHKCDFKYIMKVLISLRSPLIYYATVVVLEVLIGTFDKMFLIKFSSNNDFLVYSISLTISSSFCIITHLVTPQSLPVFFNADTISKKKYLINKYIKEICFILCLATIFYVIYGKILINIWLGNTILDELKIRIFSISIILILGVFANSITGPLQNFLISVTQEKRLMLYNIYFLVVFICSLIFGYFYGGILWVAVFFSVSYVFKLLMYTKGVVDVCGK